MGRDGDGECKDFAKGVCFRGARFALSSQTNVLILLITAASIGMLGTNKILTPSHSARTFRANGIYSFPRVVKRADLIIITGAAITNQTTGEAVHLCTPLVLPLKSTIGQVSHLIDSISMKTCGAS